VADLERLSPFVYQLPRDRGRGMRVPVRLFADEVLVEQIRRDRSVEQLANVATLPGIYRAAYGMPDMHEGYGFPVGGVAGTILPDGVISPGGIGFDINCGVRLLTTGIDAGALAPVRERLVHEISRSIPSGYGRGGRLALESVQLDHVLDEGCGYVVGGLGLGVAEDLAHTESGGSLPGAVSGYVSGRAKDRGAHQLGTLGGGNHFLEVQVVDSVFDEQAAGPLGLVRGGVTVLIHTGSRGLGHQVCTDHVRAMDQALVRHGISLPDRQLACAPFSSPEGQRYWGAMCAAANFAWANRQVITDRMRAVFARVVGASARLRLVYDVGHNTAKLERHGEHLLCVHRKGATRAFGPSSDELPAAYRGVGQPVLILGKHGYRILRPGRHRRFARAVALQRLPRRGAGHEPRRRPASGSGPRATPRARGAGDRGPLPVQRGAVGGGAPGLQGRRPGRRRRAWRRDRP